MQRVLVYEYPSALGWKSLNICWINPNLSSWDILEPTSHCHLFLLLGGITPFQEYAPQHPEDGQETSRNHEPMVKMIRKDLKGDLTRIHHKEIVNTPNQFSLDPPKISSDLGLGCLNCCTPTAGHGATRQPVLGSARASEAGKEYELTKGNAYTNGIFIYMLHSCTYMVYM